MRKLSKFALIPAVVILSLLILPAQSCYGPHITSELSKTQVNINETVTLTGRICPVEPNVTVRVAFVRPDYTYFDCTSQLTT